MTVDRMELVRFLWVGKEQIWGPRGDMPDCKSSLYSVERTRTTIDLQQELGSGYPVIKTINAAHH